MIVHCWLRSSMVMDNIKLRDGRTRSGVYLEEHDFRRRDRTYFYTFTPLGSSISNWRQTKYWRTAGVTYK